MLGYILIEITNKRTRVTLLHEIAEYEKTQRIAKLDEFEENVIIDLVLFLKDIKEERFIAGVPIGLTKLDIKIYNYLFSEDYINEHYLEILLNEKSKFPHRDQLFVGTQLNASRLLNKLLLKKCRYEQ
ncbi:MAG: hypothetical protein PHY08_12180 [Candidatus Cloacimonetes bacterium]|nr:hypothetical protein [Candidatus Cloacimonadota bacterium]